MNQANEKIYSKPTLGGFSPVIPYQYDVLKLIREDFDHTQSTPEILLSGSYGSAKSILMAHIAVTHCLMFKGARVCLARKGMPDLKRTILKEVVEHIENDLVEGVDYKWNRSNSEIHFLKTGSEIICISWSDKAYKKGRSLKLSGLIFEEIVENNLDDMEAFKTLKARLRRLPHVPENFLIAATNPDSPSHWVYEYFILPNEGQDHPNRFVFYSLTESNPFLDAGYVRQLREDMTKKEADRYLRGRWIEMDIDRIYYEYQRDRNFINESHKIIKDVPIRISWDFNIGDGKPMSVAVMQIDPAEDIVHIFNEVVIDGMRTRNSCEELADRGILDLPFEFIINGDAAGKHRDTRSVQSDYDIIKKFFSNYVTPEGNNLNFRYEVPPGNPALRKRHNTVNAYCLNDMGDRRLFVYKDAPTADRGLRLTQPKKNSFIEDDGPAHPYQHITTGIGYSIMSYVAVKDRKPQSSTTFN